MTWNFKTIFELLKEAGAGWANDKASRLGAALAFYTIFAIAPLFIITLAVAGLVFGDTAARQELFEQISELVGVEGARAVESVIAAADRPRAGIWSTIIGFTTLFLGATGVFVQLQGALNRVWNVRRLPGGGLRRFIKDRMLSFAIVLAIGFLLLVSLVLSAALAALGKFMSDFLPAHELLWQIVNFVLSLGVVTLLFAMIFKILPDVKIAWSDVWVGAFVTALLFNLGKLLLGLYLGRTTVASAYGAAGSFVIILMWVYYSAQILFFGAELTQAYASRFGSHFEPVPGAEFVERTPPKPVGNRKPRKMPSPAAHQRLGHA